MMKIGLRIPWTVAKEPLAGFAHWCKTDGFDAIDLGGPSAESAKVLQEAGLLLGTVDLPGTTKMLSSDAAVRDAGTEEAAKAIGAIADIGGDKAFCVFFPGDGSQSRTTSFENWKLSFGPVIQEAEKRGVRLALEGWPGPNNSALGVVPETLGAMFAAYPSEHFGINYDPSHLIRIGVDHQRFLNEFAGRVVHAHGKDTALDTENLYQFGNIGPTFAHTVGFGGGDWRYCIPGEGVANWPYICGRLHQAGFDGIISIELEDFRYNGSIEGEKRGLSRSREYLKNLL